MHDTTTSRFSTIPEGMHGIAMTVRPYVAWFPCAGIILALGLPAAGGLAWAGSPPAKGRTTQALVPAAEPPLPEAFVGAPPPPGAPGPCPPDPPVPVVAIQIHVPACVNAGQEIQYRICVENRSLAAAHHVLVRNPLPPNTRLVRAEPEPSALEPELLWTLGTLEGCACREIIMVLAPTGPGDVKNCARVQFEHGQCVCTKIGPAPIPLAQPPIPPAQPSAPQAQPSIKLNKAGPTQAILYDALIYRLTVTNTSAAEVTRVLLTDDLPAGLEHASGKRQLTWDLGTLAPGQSRQVEYQVVAKAVGQLCNRAVVGAAGGLREEVVSCVTVTEAKLTLAKTGPAHRYVNMRFPYQLTVTNSGTAPLENVVITDPVAPQTSFIGASQGGRLNGNQVQWSIGTLAPGASRTVEVMLRAEAAGRICNKATATADRGLTAQAEACTDLEGISALLLEVVDTDDPVEVGSDTTYIITVRNQGTLPAEEVRIEALVPAQMAIVKVTGPAPHRKDGQRVLFQPITLAPKVDARYVIQVQAQQPGDLRFKVDLFAKQLTSGPVHEEESTTAYVDIPGRSAEPPPAVPQRRHKAAAGAKP